MKYRLQTASRYILFSLILFLGDARASAQMRTLPQLRRAIQNELRSVHAKVGVGIRGLDGSAVMSETTINDNHHYPMQSVFKFPLALTVLHEIEQGKTHLDHKLTIHRKALDTNTWSPMMKDHLEQEIVLSVEDLLRYSVSYSDNNATDILFDFIGGTSVVNKYIHSLGVSQIEIVATEGQMHASWPVQYNNWCKPSAMLELLDKFYQGTLLSKENTALLMKLMTQSENAKTRIMGELPANAIVAHKTGSSGANGRGLRAATNDIGIITLPDGGHVALVVYLSDYTGSALNADAIIAKIGKLVWDYYTTGE